MALIEGCKHSIDIVIPAEAFTAATAAATTKVRQKVHLKGFRPGKAPKPSFASTIRARSGREALDKLIPEYLKKEYDRQNLQVVSRPDIKDLKFPESG